MGLLHQAMGGGIDIMAITHAGHDPELSSYNKGKASQVL